MRPKTSCFFHSLCISSTNMSVDLFRCEPATLQSMVSFKFTWRKSTNYCSYCQPLGQSKSGKKCCLDQKYLFRKIEKTRLTLFNFEFILSSAQGYKSSFYSTLIRYVHQYKPKFTTTHISFDDPHSPPCI